MHAHQKSPFSGLHRSIKIIFTTLFLHSFAIGALNAKIWYVNQAAVGDTDGVSWSKAFVDLQSALAASNEGDEIWVATGTYLPGKNRENSFQLKDGVALYGGFAGAETSRNERNWQSNLTELSGDIKGDDQGFKFNSENVYHVITGANDAVIDGFRISAGNANGDDQFKQGGGVFNTANSLTIVNCSFLNNLASMGGGVANISSESTTIKNCVFNGNQASTGGGIHNFDALPTVENCKFVDNLAMVSGGGMYSSLASPSIINCNFTGNSAKSFGGGGIFNSTSQVSILGCVFYKNSARFGGGVINLSPDVSMINSFFSENTADKGGGIYNLEASISSINCTLTKNVANVGGGLFNSNSDPFITNCILWNNTANQSDNEISNLNSTPTITHCNIEGLLENGFNHAVGNNGGGNIDSDPLFSDKLDPDGPDGRFGTMDDGLRLQFGGPCVDSGIAAGAPDVDIRGISRPRGAGIDIGSYEFISRPPVAVNDKIVTFFNSKSVINLLKNDTDFDGSIDPSSVEIVQNSPRFVAHFDGVNDRMTWGNLGLGQSTSLSKFIRFRTRDKNGVLFDTEFGAGADGGLSIVGGHLQLRCAFQKSGVQVVNIVSDIIAADGAWHSAGFTYDGLTLKTYFDGAQRGIPISDLARDKIRHNYISTCGRRIISNSRYYRGELADFVVYNQALSNLDIGNYHTGVVTQKNLVLWGKMDEGDYQAGLTNSSGINRSGISLGATPIVDPQTRPLPAHGTVVNNGNGTVTYTPDSDFLGEDRFEYIVRDNEGLISDKASVKVTIVKGSCSPEGDDMAPIFSDCPARRVVHTDKGQCFAEVLWSPPTAVDNCSEVELTSTHSPGDRFEPGTTKVTYTATDPSGNTASCTFGVTVIDEETSTFVGCPPNIISPINADETGTIVNYDVPTGMDNCTELDIVQTDITGLSNGSFFPRGTHVQEYTLSDENGHSATCRFTVTVTNQPNAGDDTAHTFGGESLTINLFDNDMDPDGTIDPTQVMVADTPSGRFVANFDGVNDSISWPNLSLNDTQRLSKFIQFRTTDTNGVLFDTEFGAGADSGLAIARGYLQLRIVFKNSGVQVINIVDASTAADGQWHSAGFTYDGSTLKTFFDGAQAGTSLSISGKAIVNKYNSVCGKRIISRSGSYFSGKLSNFVVYDIALSEANIVNYHKGLVSECNNLVLWGKMDEVGYASGLLDSSGNENTGNAKGTVPSYDPRLGIKPSNGTLVNNGDGTIIYTPFPCFRGTDSFGYTILDNSGAESNMATVTINVIEQPSINHNPLEETTDLGPHTINAKPIAFTKVTRAALNWAVNDESFSTTPMTIRDDETIFAQIPARESSAIISYYIEVEDHFGNIVVVPSGAPSESYQFEIKGVPALVANPIELEFNLGSGETEKRKLTLSNIGTGPAEWTLNEKPQTTRSLSSSPATTSALDHPLAIDWDAEHAPDTLLVSFRERVSSGECEAIHQALGCERVSSCNLIPLDVVKIPDDMNLKEACGAYQQYSEVVYVEPNYVYHSVEMPNDSSFSGLWGLHNTGQTGGTEDADIDAPEAWNQQKGSHEVIVGVIDTGIDFNHEDLVDNLWTNEAERTGTTGVDDDGNGIVDDIHGARWTSGNGRPTSGNPFDGHRHGTHVSGTIGAVGNNSTGVVGVNHTVRLMGLKFLSDSGSGRTADAIAAIEYAVDKGAHLTSNSWGGGGVSTALRDAIAAAGAAGQLFVAAAGNSGRNSDRSPLYPGAYDVDTIISVAASDHNDSKAGFSNWGAVSVDLAAPGVNTLSTTPRNGYSSFSGTSMATPHVSGVVALLLSNILPGTADPLTVKKWILDGVDPVDAFRTDGPTPVLTGGRLNAANSLALAGISWLSQNVKSGILNPKETIEIEVSADATGVNEGNYIANMIVRYNNPDNLEVVIPIDLSVTGTPEIAVLEKSLNFGRVFAGGTGTTMLSVTNKGTAGLAVNNITSDNSAFTVDRTSFELAPRETMDLTIAYAPQREGSNNGTLTIKSNDPIMPSLQVGLGGMGTPAPNISITPGILKKDLFTGEISPQSFTISNTGKSDITFKVSSAETSSTVTDPDPGAVIRTIPAPGRIFGLTWLNDSLWAVVYSSTPKIVELDPTDGTILSSIEIDRKTRVDLTNDGTNLWVTNYSDRTIESFSTDGTLLESWSAPLSTPWAISWDGDALWVGGSSHPTLYRLDSKGVVLETRNLSPGNIRYSYGMEWISKHLDGQLWISDYSSDDINQFNSTMDPFALIQEFGHSESNRPTGIAHDGENLWIAAYHSSTIALVDDGIREAVSWLPIGLTSGKIPANSSLEINTTFNAAGLSGGEFSAQIIIESNDPDEPKVSLPVTLNVTPAPEITASEEQLNFGRTFVGDSITNVLTISNDGPELLTINELSLDSNDYSVSLTSFDLNPGESQEVLVSFAPTAAGERKGILNINSNSKANPSPTVALTGEGLARPNISLTPDGVEESILSGETLRRIITISNEEESDFPWEISTQFLKPSSTARGTDTSLENILLSLDANFKTVTDSIPERFDFTEGETSYRIRSGGNEMYDSSGGNRLRTNLGRDLIYSNGVISANRIFGNNGRYFTRKYPGLFVMVANLDGVDRFEISGNLGADGRGNSDVAELKTSLSGTTFKGFVKRVYNTTEPSVNHLIIIEGDSSADQTFSTNTNSDFHQINNLAENRRLYYLLYAGANGSYMDDDATLKIMKSFLNSLDLIPAWLSISSTTGTILSQNTKDIKLTLDAAHLAGGDYSANILFMFNGVEQLTLPVPVMLHVADAPNIEISDKVLNFGPHLVGASVPETLMVSNAGVKLLTIKEITTGNTDYTVDTGNFNLQPGESREITVTFSPGTQEKDNSILLIVSNDPKEPRMEVKLKGGGLPAPDISVSPQILEDDLLIGETSSHNLTISNDGDSDLRWETSLLSKESTNTIPKISESLEDILTNLNANFDVITGKIPERFDFSEGQTRSTIWDGGSDMYDDGNILRTNLGSSIVYSDDVIRENSFFGRAGQYFTRKLPGLFVLAADMDGVNRFEIRGNLGADGIGEVDGTILKTTLEGRTFYGLVKRVHGASNPSVNHLIILEDNVTADHTFSTNTNSDYHRVFNLTGTRRMFYLLYAGTNGHYIDDTATLAIMEEFLRSAGAVPGWLQTSPISGVIPVGSSETIEVVFNAEALIGGKYSANMVITSNDPDESELLIPMTLQVTGTPDIAVDQPTLNFDSLFVGESTSKTLRIENEGTDLLTITNITANTNDYSVDLNTLEVPPRENREVTVTFAPKAAGSRNGILKIDTNDPDESTFEVVLTGPGIAPPDISVSPGMLKEKLFTGGEKNRIVTIANSGNSDLTFEISSEENSSTAASLASILTDPSPGEVIRSIPAPQRIYGLTWLNDHLWAVVNSSPRKIVELDPSDGTILSSIEMNARVRIGLTNDGTNLWVTNYSNRTIESYSTDGNLLSSWSAPLRTPWGIAWDGEALWLGGYSHRTLYRMDTKGVVLETRNLASGIIRYLYGMEWVPRHLNGELWIADYSRDDINQFNPAANPLALIQEFRHSESYRPTGIAHDGENLWVATYGSSTILMVDDGIMEAVSWLPIDITSGTVPANSSLDIGVTFNAAGLAGGELSAQIMVESNVPGKPEITIPVTLNVTAAPHIVVSDGLIDFGSVFLGESHTQTLTISNNGVEPLTISEFTSDLDEYTVDSTGFNLEPGENQEVTINFAPVVDGETDGTLMIVSNDPDNGEMKMNLKGSGQFPPSLLLTPQQWEEEMTTGQILTRTLTIINGGNSALDWNISTQFENPSDSAFNTINDLENIRLNLNANFEMVTKVIPARFDFSEGETGNYIVDGGNNMYDNGNLLWTNLGGILYSNDEIVESSIFGENGKYFTRKFPGLFVLVANTNGVDYFQTSGNLGADGVGSVEGEVLETTVFGTKFRGFVKRVYDAPNPSINHLIIVEDNPSADHTFSTSTNSDFHRIYNLSDSQRIYYLLYAGENGSYIDNSTTLAIMNSFLNALQLVPEWLSVSSNSGVIPAGSATDVDLTLNMTGVRGGDLEASINITSNDPKRSEINLPVTVHVTDAPHIAVSHYQFDFGTQLVGSSVSETLTVRNDGAELLTVREIISDNEDFTLDVASFDLRPGEYQEVVVTFAPSNGEERSGVLTIISNDPDDTPLKIALKGKGLLPPDISITPEIMEESLMTGQTSKKSLTIANEGDSDLNFEIFLEETRDAMMSRISAQFTGIDVKVTPSSNILIFDESRLDQTELDDADLFGISETENEIDDLFGLLASGHVDNSPQILHGNSEIADPLGLLTLDLFDENYFPDFSPSKSIHPNSGQIIRTIPSPGVVFGLTWMNDHLWALVVSRAPYRLVEIDPDDGAILSTITLGNDIPAGLTADGVNLWVSYYSRNRIEAYTTDGTLVTSWPSPLTTPLGIAWDGEALWIGGRSHGKLYRVKPDGTVLETRTLSTAIVRKVFDMEWVPEHSDGPLWIVDASREDINQFDPSQEPPVLIQDFRLSKPSWPVGIAHDGENLWISGMSTSTIAMVDDGIKEFVWLSAETLSGTVPAGSKIEIELLFDAIGLNGGDYKANIVVSSNDPDEAKIIVPASLHVTGEPTITISDESLDFGSLFVNHSTTKKLTLRNTGTDVLLISDISLNNEDYGVNPASFDIAPGKNGMVMVTFAPDTAGTSKAILSIASNDPKKSTVKVALVGQGLIPPIISATPKTLEANISTGTTAAKTLTVANQGGSKLTWDISTNFVEPSQTASMTINSLENILLNLNANFSAVANVIPERFDFAEGETGNRIIDGGEDMYDYGNRLWTNRGGYINYSNGVIVANSRFGANGKYFTHKYPGLFVLVADINDLNYFVISGGLGADGVGSADGTKLETNMFGSTFYGFVKRVYDAPNPSANHLIIVENNSSADHTFSTSTNSDYHQISNLSESRRLYYLMYAGTNGAYIDNDATLRIMRTFLNTLRLVPEWFRVTPKTGTTAAGSSEAVDLFLDTTGLAAGSYNGEIAIASNDPKTPLILVPLKVNITDAPDIAMSIDTFDFGGLPVGGSRTHTLTIFNEGTNLLIINDIKSSTNDYKTDIISFKVNPGESQSVNIVFSPISEGKRLDSLTVISNDPDEPTLPLSLMGEGLPAPDITVTPGSIEDHLFPGEKLAHTLTISNNGNQDLEFETTLEDTQISWVAFPDTEKIEHEEQQTDAPRTSSGGPSKFGYLWLDSNDPEGPTFDWIEISATGVDFGITEDDGVITADLGFAFNFFGQEFSQITIGENGMVSFVNEGFSDFANTPIEGKSTPNNFIAPFWDDHLIEKGGKIYYETRGLEPNRQFIVEWYGVPHIEDLNSVFTYELILSENDHSIVFQYLNMNGPLGDGSSATIGVEDESGADGLQVSFNSAYVHNDLAIKIIPKPKFISIDTFAATLKPGKSVNLSFEVSAAGLIPADYKAGINITSNDPNESEVIIPLLLHVLKRTQWITGLIGHWKFDEERWTGTTREVIDSSSGDNHGTSRNGAQILADGKINHAGDFDGGNDYVDVGKIAVGNPLQLAEGGTLSAWFNQKEGGDRYQRLLDKSSSGMGNNGYSLIADPLQKAIWIDVSGANYRSDVGVYEFNEWTHIAAVITGNAFEIYVNGVKVNGRFISGSAKLPVDVATTMRIGTWNHSTGREFKGFLDDLRVYNRALTANEIKVVHDFANSDSTLIAHYPLEEGIGCTTADMAGGGEKKEGTLEPGCSSTSNTGPTWSTEVSPLGNALEFDGDDDYVNLGLIEVGHPLQLSSGGTLSAWFSQRNGDRYQRILDKSNLGMGTNGYALIADPRERAIWINVSGANYRSDVGVYEFNEWTHVAAVITGSVFEIYVNGAKVNGRFISETAKLPVDVATTMRIGTWNHSTGREFNGFLDDLRIYNRALTNSEIRLIHGEGSSSTSLVVQSAVTEGSTPVIVNSARSGISSFISETIYENAEDGTIDGWQAYGEGNVLNVEDISGNRIISTEAHLVGDPFRLGLADLGDWNNTEEFTAYFAILMEENAAVYFRVDTSEGEKYLCYTPGAETMTVNGGVICFGLGIEPDGQWHEITRNLANDLDQAIPNATLVSIKDFYVFGSIKLDNLRLLKGNVE